MDGGFGTMLQKENLDVGRVPEVLNITHPQVVQRIQKAYIDAGADIICTCSFGVNKYKIEGCGYTVEELMKAAVKNAREAAEGTDTKIGLDIGPIGRLLEPNGSLSFEEAYEIFKLQVEAGSDADVILIETMTDLYEMKAAVLAAKENAELPIIATMSFEANQRTFTGTEVRAMALTLEGLGVDAIGMNCSLGPAEFKPLIEELSKWTTLPIVSKANAGLPNPATGEYDVEAEQFAKLTADLIPHGVKAVGGCCGTTPAFIKAIHEAFEGKKYCRQNPNIPAAVCTPEKTIIIDQPRIIGERINPTGKKKLKEALKNGDMDYVLTQAADQIRDGAEILDVNAGVPGIDEKSVIVNIVKALQGITDAPLQIDSGDPEVIEAALRVYSGKAIVNSVNGEEKSLASILPLVKKYGAAVVGLTLDEDGIPTTKEKRIEIAERILSRALALGIPRKDVYIDCLTLTVSAEQENAAGTLEAIKYVKEELGLKTVLGVSNISFGLPNRSIINHNFLQMALTCGLDLPIMNPGSAEMMQAVAVYKLIMNIDKGSMAYIKNYSGEVVTSTVSGNPTSAEKPQQESEVEYAINNGLGAKCRELIEKELDSREPLDVINNTLIPILDRAGKDFEAGITFIPQLMLCASTAQQAFDVIKEKIEAAGTEQVSRGTIVIATVKGDIHDIGKNIVKVILENYGYDIIDLGKDVEPQRVVDAVKEKDVKLVGLSALMTTTLHSMAETIRLLKTAAPECKIMVGGAVLTEDYALEIGADFHVKDAKESADAAKLIYA
ncbi:homocysteine S-methyltransferase family protein [Emergencia timonensis]|uniref:homocysteine S-methyltransferase family protein n=1 Tax=Emergencia timonensis TaxID=1776384 RepID=UPI00295AAA9C|nr:homocysteine S-methyltransferase family protein [Emergencia timonensis]WNX90578.1 homocysteine S-methyltransferase family protein [Emergencia timonensis]